MEFLLGFIAENPRWTVLLFFALFAAWRIGVKELAARNARKILSKALNTGAGEPLTLHPEVNPALCAGCGACTSVCPEGDILRIIDHKAVLVSPTKCVGHGECEVACPTGAISLVFGTKTRGMDIPRISGDFETNVPGLYIAGELGGMGLIRNAIKQGNLAAQHALKNLGDAAAAPADTDLLVIGAGPAGLAASLTAIADRKHYICIDQSSLGGSILTFPRQKVVMTYPVELPIVGKVKFKKNRVSKEELLDSWEQARKKTGFQLREGTKFEGLDREDGVFVVRTSKGPIRARKVILCMGVRGSPRKLGVPGEAQSKVTYSLLDPEQYQRKHVAVVGGGNAGVEAAQYLAKAQYGNQVTLLVRGGILDRCNDENQEIIRRLEREGRVKIWYHSSVKEIGETQLLIQRQDGVTTIPNDFLFIFAGAEMPHKFLMSLGIRIEKVFGKGLTTGWSDEPAADEASGLRIQLES